jgi:hypothetical protein
MSKRAESKGQKLYIQQQAWPRKAHRNGREVKLNKQKNKNKILTRVFVASESKNRTRH